MANPRIPSPTEARAAMTAVVDALSKWRDEVATSTEHYNATVLDKIADAADTLGWPKDVLETTKSSMQQASEMQLKIIDQMTDTWRQQLKAPMPGGGFPTQLPTTSPFGAMPFNPMDLWLQTATAWQRSFADSLSMWTDRSRH